MIALLSPTAYFRPTVRVVAPQVIPPSLPGATSSIPGRFGSRGARRACSMPDDRMPVKVDQWVLTTTGTTVRISAIGRRGQRCAYTTFRARTKDHFRVLVTVRSLQSAGKGHERCQPGWPRAPQERRDGVKRKGGSGGTEVGREIRRKRSTVEPCVTTSAGRRLTCAVPARDTTAAGRGCFDQG